jgi:F-type H+-transporting ATPase subunit b
MTSRLSKMVGRLRKMAGSVKKLLLLGAFAALCLAQEQAGGGTAASSEPSEAWKWANFAILAVGLGYLIAKSAPAFFQARTESIQKDIATARKTKEEAERRAAEMDARLAALGQEIEKFRAQARAEMEQEGERIRRETAAQIHRLEQQAESEIESATKAARAELRALAAQLALDQAEQRIRARLDEPAEASLVDNFVADLAQSAPRDGRDQVEVTPSRGARFALGSERERQGSKN